MNKLWSWVKLPYQTTRQWQLSSLDCMGTEPARMQPRIALYLLSGLKSTKGRWRSCSSSSWCRSKLGRRRERDLRLLYMNPSVMPPKSDRRKWWSWDRSVRCWSILLVRPSIQQRQEFFRKLKKKLELYFWCAKFGYLNLFSLMLSHLVPRFESTTFRFQVYSLHHLAMAPRQVWTIYQ